MFGRKCLILRSKNTFRHGLRIGTLQYADTAQRTIRTAHSGSCRLVRLRSDGLRRPAPGACPSGGDVRPAVPLPQIFGLQGTLRPQHHRRRPLGARCRRGRRQNRQESPLGATRTDGSSALLHRALPPCDGCTECRDAFDRTPRLGAYHRTDRVRTADSRCRLRLCIERLGLFRRRKIQRRPPLRPSFGPQSRRHRGQHPRTGRPERQTPLLRLRSVEKASPEHIMRWPRRGATASRAGIWNARPCRRATSANGSTSTAAAWT